MASRTWSEFGARYEAKLAELTFNSKPLINTLSMLAEEAIGNGDNADSDAVADEIVRIILTRIASVRDSTCSPHLFRPPSQHFPL